MFETFREMFCLLNDELRRLYNKEDISDDEAYDLDLLMPLFGLEKCYAGADSWDSYEQAMDELAEIGVAPMSYEDYMESDLRPYVEDPDADDDYFA